MQYVLVVLLVIGYIGVPVVLIMGWWRWLRSPSPQGLLSSLSLAGFVLGSASALLVIGTISYAITAGGFRFYDPTLIKVYRAGCCLPWED